MANDADLDFGGLPVRVSCHYPFAEELEAVHLGLDATSGVVAGPFLPDRSPQKSRRSQRLIARCRGGAVRLPRSTISADRDDRFCAMLEDRRMAPARVEHLPEMMSQLMV